MGRFFDPLTDWSFKRLFGSEPNKDILVAFLNDLFAGEKVIVDLVYGPNEHNGVDRDAKKVLLDLYCTGDKGEKIIVEMQRGRQDFFRERTILYVSKAIADDFPAGSEHFNYDIPEVYLIAILEFRMNREPSEQYFHDICLMDRNTNEIFYKKLGYKFIELPNFTKQEEELETDVEKWCFMLKNMSRLNEIPRYLDKRVFRRIFQIAEINNLSQEEREMYEASLKEKWDYENVLASARREEGEKKFFEGKLEGAEQKSYEVVSNLISEFNFSDEQAALATTTSVDFVKKVQAGLLHKKK